MLELEEDFQEEVLYSSMVSAWIDLNDFSRKRNQEDFLSALYSVISYVINRGNKEEYYFKKVLGRICLENGKSLTENQLNDLGLTKVSDMQDYGLKLLKEAAEKDEDVEIYLNNYLCAQSSY